MRNIACVTSHFSTVFFTSSRSVTRSIGSFSFSFSQTVCCCANVTFSQHLLSTVPGNIDSILKQHGALTFFIPAIIGRMDIMVSISAALQRLTAKPAESKPYRISDLIPRNWEGGNEKGEFRSFMSDLHLWMQAWSDQGEQMLAMVESIDRFDNNVIAFDCSDEEFRSIESALYQVLHRTTSNEPLRK